MKDTISIKIRKPVLPAGTRPPRTGALRAAAVYFVVSMAWILLSDKLMTAVFKDIDSLALASLIKGALFILTTSVLLFLLVYAELRREAVNALKLDESYARLRENYETLEMNRENLMRSEEEYRQLYKSLETETEQLRVTLESIGDGVISTGVNGEISMLNAVAAHLLGVARETAPRMPMDRALRFRFGSSGARFATKVRSALAQEHPDSVRGTIRAKDPDGSERVLTVRAAPILGSNAVLGAVIVLRDETEQKKKEEEILYLSYHDLLTGLYNRNFFEEELKRLDTERQLPLSVIMGDANNLKLVNDVFGHAQGDYLLQALAQVLRDTCRSDDIISRWGGDEFTILLPRTDSESVSQVCRRIQRRCREYKSEEKYLTPSISLGHGTKLESGADISATIKAAEDMMYKNKLLDSRSAHAEFLEAMRRRVGESGLETEKHTGRVADLCVRTGRVLNLKDGELADLKILALLHDVGKAAIDTSILNKPGTLNEAELEQIKRHSGIGYRIVRSAPELALVADYILGHHERWDGDGYPQGLKGESIPLASRIFAVVDAFVVMTQGRPYRQAVNQETALMEIYRNAGTQFDPDVVNAFAGVLDDLLDRLNKAN